MALGFRAIAGAISIVMLLLLAIPLADSLEDTASDPDEFITRDAALLEDTSTFITLNDGKGTNHTVWKTTGFAVNLTGADDSFIQSSQSVDFSTDQNWTVSVWAYVDSDAASENMTAVSLNGRLLISYNGTAGNWSAWYFDEGGRDSFVVNVSDNNEQPGNLTNVIVRSNSTHLNIYRNNTLGDSKNITTDNIADAPVNDTNWNGRLEEIRTFDEALNNSKRQELVDSPAEQQPNLNTTARIMFDQPDKSTQILLYADGEIEQSNVTFSAGIAEDVMDPPSLTNDILADTDYEWRVHGPAIRPVADRELDGAPIAYASYDFGGDTAVQLVEDLSGALRIAAIIPLLVVITIIVRTLRM